MKPYAPQPPVLGAIDEGSPLGKYRQIREILRTHAKTVCQPGFKLPPERELAASLGRGPENAAAGHRFIG